MLCIFLVLLHLISRQRCLPNSRQHLEWPLAGGHLIQVHATSMSLTSTAHGLAAVAALTAVRGDMAWPEVWVKSGDSDHCATCIFLLWL